VSVVRHTAYNLLGAVIPISIGLVAVPLYLHAIGPERFGFLSIAWLLLGYFGLFDLGLGRATLFRIAAMRDAEPAARARVFWTALAVNVGMGIVGGLVLWVAGNELFKHVFKIAPALRPEVLASVPLLASAVPIATASGVLTGALQGRERFLNTNVVSVVSTTLFQVLPLAVALTRGPYLPVLLTAAVVARLVALATLGLMCHWELTRGYPIQIDRDEVSRLLRYGVWVTLTSAFAPFLVAVDRFVIGAVLGAIAVTTYTVPYQLTQRVAIIPTALTNALFPRLAATNSSEHDSLSAKAALTLAGLLSFPVLCGVIVLEPFLRFWVGPDLGTQAAPVGRILLIGFWVNAFALVPYVRLQASGRPDSVTKILLVEIPPYLGMLYLGLKYDGLIGCALALCARNCLDWLLLSLASKSPFSALPQQAINGALLALAAITAGQWGITDPRAWAVDSLLAGLMLATGWFSVPADVKVQLGSRVGGLLRTARAGM
jgi:O-antigen/teichoic acid export membrane protein